jgi:hypothetical protein
VTVRDRERIVELSTLDFLRILEAEQRIQSADRVFEMAALAGRIASRVEKLPEHDDSTQRALHELVRHRAAARKPRG